jgi:hypothetical protein
MRIQCLSCREEINLDHPVFYNYQGPVKCFGCGQMMQIRTIEGALARSSLWHESEIVPFAEAGELRPGMTTAK